MVKLVVLPHPTMAQVCTVREGSPLSLEGEGTAGLIGG